MPKLRPIKSGASFSRTITITIHALAVVLSAIPSSLLAAENSDLRWVGCGITRKAFMHELSKSYERETGIKISVEGGGATRGIRDTSQGISHFGGSCRSQIKKPGSLFAIAEEKSVRMIPVAWDALAVITHKDNPVSSVSLDQLRGIFLGGIRNWKEVGGKDQEIKLLTRKSSISGVGRTIRELIFADYEIAFAEHAEQFASTGPLEKKVEEDMASFAITGVSSARRRDVKILELEGVFPSFDNIKQGAYLLYRPLYLVTPRRGTNPAVDQFVDYALSESGRAILRRLGTVPYTDAIHLVLKQREQRRQAASRGLDLWGFRKRSGMKTEKAEADEGE